MSVPMCPGPQSDGGGKWIARAPQGGGQEQPRILRREGRQDGQWSTGGGGARTTEPPQGGQGQQRPVGQCRSVSAIVGTCWPISADEGPCRPMLADVGPCRPILGIIRQCRPISDNRQMSASKGPQGEGGGQWSTGGGGAGGNRRSTGGEGATKAEIVGQRHPMADVRFHIGRCRPMSVSMSVTMSVTML